jgi:hypothetical protein
MKTRKIITIIGTVILLIFTSECSTIKTKFWHDNNNPCTPGDFQNDTECEYWKKTFPKEYKAYQKRMKELNKN